MTQGSLTEQYFFRSIFRFAVCVWPQEVVIQVMSHCGGNARSPEKVENCVVCAWTCGSAA